MAKSIFLSYRRDGGEYMAQILYDRLVARGYDVFYDIESLKAGAFDRRLLKEIERCDCVVAILPKNGLDRCNDPQDWVRQELAHAFALHKPLVPVMLRDFVFPETLPEEIAEIKLCHGLNFEDMGFLDARIDKLIDLITSREESGERYAKKHSGPALIRNVCTIGGKDRNTPFPTDSKYSQIINMDIYPFVYFHANLKTPCATHKTVKCGYNIYDSNNNLVMECAMDVEFHPGNDRFSLGWCLKAEDGSFVPTGDYVGEVWIENSRGFECNFTVTSHEDRALNRQGSAKKRKAATTDVEERIRLLEKKLSKRKGFLLAVLMYLGYGVMVWGLSENIGVAFLGILTFLTGMILLIGHVRKYQVKNGFLAFLIGTFGLPVYSVCMLIGILIDAPGHAAWKKELQELKKLV